LNFYKALLALRHTNPALLEGSYTALNVDDPDIISYLRRYKDHAVLVVINMSLNARSANFDLSALGLTAPNAKTLVTDLNSAPKAGKLGIVNMEPLSVYIAELSK
jgi:glycosidase